MLKIINVTTCVLHTRASESVLIGESPLLFQFKNPLHFFFHDRDIKPKGRIQIRHSFKLMKFSFSFSLQNQYILNLSRIHLYQRGINKPFFNCHCLSPRARSLIQEGWNRQNNSGVRLSGPSVVRVPPCFRERRHLRTAGISALCLILSAASAYLLVL